MNTIAHGVFGDALWTPATRFVDRFNWFTTFVLDSKRTATPGNLLDKHSTLTVTVKPLLANLLNCSEEIAFSDILNAMEDNLDVAIPDESQPDTPQSENDTVTEESVRAEPQVDNTPNTINFPLLPPSIQNVSEGLSVLKNSPETASTAMAVDSPPTTPSTPTSDTHSSTNSKGLNSHIGNDSSDTEGPLSKKARTSSTSLIAAGSIGISKSNRSEKAAQEAADRGEYVPAARARWKRKIRNVDPFAQFNECKLREVRCSKCGKTVKTKTGTDLPQFEEHWYKTCTGRKNERAAGRTHTLDSEFMQLKWTSPLCCPTLPNGADKPLPCPGLNENDEPRIPAYLKRSAVSGGGSRSLTAIAKEQFEDSYRRLTEKEQQVVLDTQYHECSWRNDHKRLRVFFASCMRFSSGKAKGDRVSPCTSCLEVLKLKSFKKALAIQAPEEANYKFTNHRFRNATLGEHYANVKGLKDIIENSDTSPFVQFARGALQGKYNDQEVFLGLVYTMVQKQDREQRGVGMQNFVYTPAWDEFAHMVSIHSPRAHKLLSEHFAARTERNIRLCESRRPKLPMTINEETFTSVKSHLKALQYNGPVALSCDDTKLLPSLRLFYDGVQKTHFLVGDVNGPMIVPNPESIKEIMNSENIVKGTKVRLWTLQVPLPKMPPIVLTALPIPDNMKVPNLLQLHKDIIHGLLDAKINVISYSCDGTENERSVQRSFLEAADLYVRVNIPDPGDGHTAPQIYIGFFRGQPIVMIQDSKHALKTARNNLFSGARLLVMGNYVAMYEQVRELAYEEGSPLYLRDVEKLDRQDDNAAARLFSAATIQFLTEHHPDHVGLIVYLFVFGELCDAYQNRHIPHSERILMVLRTRYFLDMWQKYLDCIPTYSRKQNFVSRKFTDIVDLLVTGLISLIIVHRDHLGETFPLLPWLHSSEACEHIFGIARQIVSDFTLLDFYQMLPKLGVRIQEFLLDSRCGRPNSDSTA
ncbi:hypothetical protein VKT23_013815 [Stygiomarasmius scandens]|uniref:Transposase n=1 Tax=Marasmiellus scandens TaxID=2682957 RepID=A0ABR1J4E9_9AGAR